MSAAHINDSSPRRPLRLWPGVAAAALLVLARYIAPVVLPDAGGLAIIGGMAGGLTILLWWLFFSRAPWSDRVGALLVMAAALLAASPLVHPSISNGFMGMMLPVFAIPLMCLALVGALAASLRLSSGARRASVAAAILLGCGLMLLVRTGGVSGEGESDLHWRWTMTPEERLLARAADDPAASSAASGAAQPAAGRAPAHPSEAAPAPSPVPAAAGTAPRTPGPLPAGAAAAVPADPASADPSADWPGFRGPARDGVVPGVRIETDWSKRPPILMWRKPIGPGWSSFAVRGDLLYTQEQRGDDEIVSGYRLTTGEPVWRHRDPVRFWESNGGAGPRATPTVRDGRVYTMGATGLVNALDADTGAVLWSRNAAADTRKEIPDWGIASSPLAIDDLVIVAVAGQLAAYDARTGTRRWLGEAGGGGYSSPHLATIDGVPQILLPRGARTMSLKPADGSLLWQHTAERPAVSILQPGFPGDGGVLIAAGDAMGGTGIRRIAVARRGPGWTVEERWTSRGLKPYFNDFVVHEGHAFGFDASILACIDLNDGTRKWKGGRYGHGQLLLLPDQDVLLVLSEEGELALVKAAPDQFTELARMPAIEGKTWNHPVIVRDILLVRNGEEMAAFRLPAIGR